MWTYHRSARGPRIELVSRQLEAGLESYWASELTDGISAVAESRGPS